MILQKLLCSSYYKSYWSFIPGLLKVCYLFQWFINPAITSIGILRDAFSIKYNHTSFEPLHLLGGGAKRRVLEGYDCACHCTGICFLVSRSQRNDIKGGTRRLDAAYGDHRPVVPTHY